jgi:beta-lactamase class A
LGHNFHYIVADTTDSGSATDCLVLAGELTNKVAPTESMFKLYILQAVVRAVDNGLIQWDNGVEVTDESNSLPSGVTQDNLAGTVLMVEELAERVISISDNTATNLLIQLVG